MVVLEPCGQVSALSGAGRGRAIGDENGVGIRVWHILLTNFDCILGILWLTPELLPQLRLQEEVTVQ